jgi:signal transduction histidine kinase
MVRSFERTNNLPLDLSVLHVTDGLGIYEENPNPVMRVSNRGLVLYANRGSRALCQAWKCNVGDPVPEVYVQRIEKLLESGEPQNYDETLGNYRLHLQFVPVPGLGYVDVFGYPRSEPGSPFGKENSSNSARFSAKNETRIKRRTDFARAAVHELRNPLTPILAASEMLVNRLGEEGAPARLARQINASAIELNARIGELFDLVRAEMGAFALDYQPVCIEELLNEIIGFLRPGAERKGVKLVLDLDDNLLEIYADREHLREALGYLVENAISRCPAKAIVNISCTIRQNMMVLQIRVTCLKIPDAISHYFSTPYSIQSLNREHFSSVGLKLTLAKLLIELHGGNIDVETDAEGNRFTVRIPLTRSGNNPGGHS